MTVLYCRKNIFQVHRNCFLNGFYDHNSVLNSKRKQLDETLPYACRISSLFDVCVTMHH